MGLLFTPVGIGVGTYVALTAIGEGYQWFPLYAGIAAFVTATILWRLLIERKQKYTTLSGIAVGALIGSVSHYVCWYLQILVANLWYAFFGTGASSLGDPPMDLLTAIPAAFTFSAWSWFFFGWLTIPAGGIIGGVFCRYLRKNRTSPSSFS